MTLAAVVTTLAVVMMVAVMTMVAVVTTVGGDDVGGGGDDVGGDGMHAFLPLPFFFFLMSVLTYLFFLIQPIKFNISVRPLRGITKDDETAFRKKRPDID